MTDSGSHLLGSDTLVERLRRATIGRYDVYAELGAGGMATVFLALDLALDRKVAIKVLNPALATSADNVERFKREAKVAASLNHPNIIGIHAVGDDPGLAYFVMKYIEGRSLDTVVREMGAQSLPFVRGVIGAAGKALHYAHSRGVVHRDVKPANFMLDKDGWLVVTDFGIAKMDDAKGLTMTGSVIGTPYYMAPEQFNGQPVTAAADQYALGIVAFELLTGRQPFAGETVAEVMKGHLFDPIPSVRTIRPDLPESVDIAIARMLAKDPKERYATLEEAVAAFGGVSPTQEHEVRTQIIKLAISGAMEQPQLHVPVSPVPAGRARPERVSQVDVTRPMTPALGGAAVPARASRRRSPLVFGSAAVALGVLIGGALLRPDLVDRVRKSLPFGLSGVSDTATRIVAAPVDPAAQLTDEERRLKGGGVEGTVAAVSDAVRDSIARALQQQLRDSIAALEQARTDSIARAVARARSDSIARADSLLRVRRALASRPGAAARQDRRAAALNAIGSNLRGDPARVGANEPPTTAPASSEPPVTPPAAAEPPPTPAFGTVRLGSPCPGSVLYVNGNVDGAIGRVIRDLQLPAGQVRLRVRTLAGITWDTTFTVGAGVTQTIGRRPSQCQ